MKKITIQFEDDFDRDELRKLAKEKGRSMNKQIIELIKNFIVSEQRRRPVIKVGKKKARV